MENYIISDETRNSAPRAWGKLQGQRESFDKEVAISYFDELRSIDRHFYDHNICKLLYYRMDMEFVRFFNSEFGQIHYIVGHGYRRGKGVEPNLALARSQYEIGMRQGNIPCRLAFCSTFSVWRRVVAMPILLKYGIIFAFIGNRNEYDTRVLY